MASDTHAMTEPRTYSGNGHTATIADPSNITPEECLALARCGATAWNQWRKEHPGDPMDGINTASFSRYDFVLDKIEFQEFYFGLADFSNARFPSEQDFRRCTFDEGTRFVAAVFDGLVKFDGSQFNTVDFSRTEFHGLVSFQACNFQDLSKFENCCFNDDAIFLGALFHRDVRFDRTQFVKIAGFQGALFGSKISFRSCLFEGAAEFEALNWSHLRSVFNESGADLNKALELAEMSSLSPNAFADSINFSASVFKSEASFKGRTFGWRSIFDGAQFDDPPQFFDCKINQQLTFDQVGFPEPTGKPDSARAYRALKLAYSQQQATREEQHFFRLEMAEEAKAAECSHEPVQWLYIVYREFAEFGFSLWRPALLLFITLVLMLPLYAWQAGLQVCWPGSAACNMAGPLIQFASAHALPGFEKLAEPASKVLFGDQLGVWTVLTVLLHKAVSVSALFLMGLALRNLFKMK
jgi:hypothetical protein